MTCRTPREPYTAGPQSKPDGAQLFAMQLDDVERLGPTEGSGNAREVKY